MLLIKLNTRLAHRVLRKGETRYTSGSEETRYQYTGQYSYESDFGLQFYNARWYDSSLGRFTSADTIVPSVQGVQGYDRYAYANNNPVIYIDPTGRAVCLLEPEECDYLQNLNSGGGGGISNGTLSKDYAARFYRSFLKDRYDWGVADDFTENELKVMRRTAQDIETYVDGLTGGMGQEWMNEYMGGINIGTRVILFLARHLHRTQVQVSNPLKNTEIATPPKYKSGGSQRHRGKLIIY